MNMIGHAANRNRTSALFTNTSSEVGEHVGQVLLCYRWSLKFYMKREVYCNLDVAV